MKTPQQTQAEEMAEQAAKLINVENWQSVKRVILSELNLVALITERDEDLKREEDVRRILTIADEERDTLKKQNEELVGVLERLASICTCDRPTKQNADGSITAPRPHTSRCVSEIARSAITATMTS